MTNEELKKKIVDILQLKLQECPLQPHGIIYRDAAEYIADALITAGIGDVSEYKRRAEVAEKAGRIIQRDMGRVFDVSNPRICELITNIWDLAKKQAENELQEERNDE